MKIKSKILENWQHLRSSEDCIKIADTSGLHCQTIQDALNNGECTSIEVIEAISSYYEDKAEILKNYIN